MNEPRLDIRIVASKIDVETFVKLKKYCKHRGVSVSTAIYDILIPALSCAECSLTDEDMEYADSLVEMARQKRLARRKRR